jgi:hypothetical protein
VLTDLPGSVRAAGQLPRVRQVVVPRCGHAPQIEKARLVNRLVSRFLRDELATIPAGLDPGRVLADGSVRSTRRQGILATLSRPAL